MCVGAVIKRVDIAEDIGLRAEDEADVHASYPHVSECIVVSFDDDTDAVRLHVSGDVDAGDVTV